jgi:hypothetical protein
MAAVEVVREAERLALSKGLLQDCSERGVLLCVSPPFDCNSNKRNL